MKRVLLVFAVLLAFHVSSAVAEETIVLAVGDWPPYFSESLPHQGTAARIIREAFAAEGYRVVFEFLPWARAYKDARARKYDGTAVWLKIPEREKAFYYSDPVVREEHVFFHLKNFSFDWNRVEDLKGLSIGGLIGFSYGKALDEALASGGLTMDRIGSDRRNFGKLLMGRIQVYPQEMHVGYHVLQTQIPPDQARLITHHPKLLMTQDSYLLMPKKNERSKELIVIFNRGLQRVKEGGSADGSFEIIPYER